MRSEPRDVTDLRMAEQRHRLVLEHAVGGYLVLSDDLGILDSSDSSRLWPALVPGRATTLGVVGIHPDDRGRALQLIERARSTRGAPQHADVRGVDDAGRTRWIELTVTDRRDHPAVGGIIVNFHDIDARKRAELALLHQATHDELTGLANRTRLTDRLDRALEASGASGCRAGLVFLDIDQFQLVNDGLGHDVGDQLLRAVSVRLVAATAPTETLARFGGDSFAVVCQVAGDGAIRARAGQLAAGAAGSFRIGDSQVVITVTAGAAWSREGDSAVTLQRDADTALHRAKAQGPGRVAVFRNQDRGRAATRLGLSTALAGAVERQELEVVYQPIVDIVSGSPVACEALARWHHPTRGLIGPDEFIPLAEQTGLIGPIGAWVLDEAIAQLTRWDRDLPAAPRLDMAVNLSTRQLSDPGCASSVAHALARGGLAGDRLNLELTESALVENLVSGQDTMHALRQLGVRLSIDDFGTGYSSLSYLKRLPIDTLKIDRSFVVGLGQDRDDTSIVAAIVSLAGTLDLDLIAEGVETDRQRLHLLDLACRHGQGFWWCRPLSAGAFGTWLQAGGR